MVQAMDKLRADRAIDSVPLRSNLAAVSVGIIGGTPMLDLNYEEDSRADVDFNVVMTDSGEFVEIQGTAERESFPRSRLVQLLDLAEAGIQELIRAQQRALEAARSG